MKEEYNVMFFRLKYYCDYKLNENYIDLHDELHMTENNK
jgi:hypothetical protein